MLFREQKRTNYNGKTKTEGDFEYLENSAREESRRIREFLSYWVKKYPENERNELIKRLQSDGNQYKSASFELLLYAILTNVGCQLLPHPVLPNSNKHPDYLVTTSTGKSFYLEAVLASEKHYDDSAEKRKEVFISGLDKIQSPNFLLDLHIEGALTNCPSSKPYRREVEQWLQNLDPDEQLDTQQFRIPEYPCLTLNVNGLLLTLTAIPRRPDSRGDTSNPIVSRMGGRFVNQWQPIADSIRYKGRKYGELDRPLLIAVNSDAQPLRRDAAVQALFGQEQFIYYRNLPREEHAMRRGPDGAWRGIRGPEYTRVSGAWLFGNLTPWRLAATPASNRLYFNPWTTTKLPKALRQVHHCTGENGHLTFTDGTALSKLLQISNRWPLED